MGCCSDPPVGAYITQPVYPRGTMRGWVCRSENFICVGCNGAALAVKSESDGRIFGLSSKARMLKVQKEAP